MVSELPPPNVTSAFGTSAITQGDIVSLTVHLGCTKEVSSFIIKLNNDNNKYGIGGAYPITVGLSGYIMMGRSPYCPMLITGKVEDAGSQDTPTEHYRIFSGRCWGEKLFRYTVTKTYLASKGEGVVKDIVDFFSGLSHTRGITELIENTDTTYTELPYEDAPAWDILRYIADSSDKSGVIGYDHRVEPDGKFAFFPKLSKVHNILKINEPGNENVDMFTWPRKSISRIRNKIKVNGLADKSDPTDKVAWTRSLTPTAGTWAAAAGTVSLDATGAPDGGACIKLLATTNYYGTARFTLNLGHLLNFEQYPILGAQFNTEDVYSGTGQIVLYDNTYKSASKKVSVTPDGKWQSFETGVGSAYASQFDYIDSGFDWTQILRIEVSFYFPSVDTGSFWIHRLYVGGARYSSVQEDVASQFAHTDGQPREYVETDEELWSDNECTLRAKSLLAAMKDPDYYVTVQSSLFVYNDTPVLPGDKLKCWFPNEGIADTYFRVDSVEYVIPEGNPHRLEMTLELDKVQPQLADYLYGLRCHTPNVEKLSRTKVGKRGAPILSRGSLGSPTRFGSNVEVDKLNPVFNLMYGGSLLAAYGHDGIDAVLAAYSGNLLLYSDTHKVLPPLDTLGVLIQMDLGMTAQEFNNLYLLGVASCGWLNVAGFTVINALRQLVNCSISADSIDRDGWTGDIPAGSIIHVLHGKVTGYT